MENQRSSTIAKIILNINNPIHLDHPFDYLIPKDLDRNAQIGVRVRVRFRGKLTDGFIVDRVEDSKIKSLISIHKIYSDLPLLNTSTWNFCKEVAARYCSKHYDVLRHIVPSRHAGIEKKILQDFKKKQHNNFFKPMPDIAKLNLLPSLKTILENLNNTSKPFKINLQVLRSMGKQSWDYILAIVIIAYANAGLGVIAVMPDSQDVNVLYKRLLQFTSSDNLATLTFSQGKESRYKNFCEIILGLKRIVIGTRSSIYAPVHNLGMIIIWDELDPSHQEISNPYAHTRDLALLRSSLENTSLLFCSFSVGCAIQRLIEKDYLKKITYERTFLRDLTPIMQSTVNDTTLHDDYAYKKHLPDTVFKIIRNNLKKGPILIQIQSARTKSYLSCNNCNYIARCIKCNGTIEYINDLLICKLCSCNQSPWVCQECKYMQLQAKMSESERVIKELGFSFPGIPIISSYKGHIIKEIPNKNILVIATPGSEPFANYGYSAAIILNADFQLNQPYLNAGEQAFARWFKVASLVRIHPYKGTVLLVSNNKEISNNFIKWSPDKYIHNQLMDRYELELPPSIRIAIIEGNKQDIQFCINDINSFNQKIIGPYPLIESDSNINSNIKYRAVVKFNYKTGKDIVQNIKNSKIKLSLLHKIKNLHIKIDANYIL